MYLHRHPYAKMVPRCDGRRVHRVPHDGDRHLTPLVPRMMGKRWSWDADPRMMGESVELGRVEVIPDRQCGGGRGIGEAHLCALGGGQAGLSAKRRERCSESSAPVAISEENDSHVGVAWGNVGSVCE